MGLCSRGFMQGGLENMGKVQGGGNKNRKPSLVHAIVSRLTLCKHSARKATIVGC